MKTISNKILGHIKRLKNTRWEMNFVFLELQTLQVKEWRIFRSVFPSSPIIRASGTGPFWTAWLLDWLTGPPSTPAMADSWSRTIINYALAERSGTNTSFKMQQYNCTKSTNGKRFTSLVPDQVKTIISCKSRFNMAHIIIAITSFRWNLQNYFQTNN